MAVSSRMSRVRRFARVTNLNDCVTRVPTFFTDTGDAFVHADGEHTSWYDAFAVTQHHPNVHPLVASNLVGT